MFGLLFSRIVAMDTGAFVLFTCPALTSTTGCTDVDPLTAEIAMLGEVTAVLAEFTRAAVRGEGAFIASGCWGDSMRGEDIRWRGEFTMAVVKGDGILADEEFVIGELSLAVVEEFIGRLLNEFERQFTATREDVDEGREEFADVEDARCKCAGIEVVRGDATFAMDNE